MSLHQDQVARIDEWLRANVAEHCPACGLFSWWSIHDGLYGLPCVALDRLNVREGLELVATTCKRCSYTALFLASRIGVGPRATRVGSPLQGHGGLQ
jgi:hypothetical protein